jgi:hypothetical protein
MYNIVQDLFVAVISFPRGVGRQQDVIYDGLLCLTMCDKDYSLSVGGKLTES